jgi:hypothetical protein
LSSIGDLVSFAASASRAHVSPYRQRARENNQELVQQLDAFLFVAARADAREPGESETLGSFRKTTKMNLLIS